MFISRIKLYNWKNFHDCDIRLSERSFVVGANATGKSNFLDAMRFLRDIVRQGGGLQAAIANRGGVTKIRCLAARSRTDVRIEVDLNEQGSESPKWRYVIDFKHIGGGILKSEAAIVEESVYDYVNRKSVISRDAKSKNEDEETLKYTHIEQASRNAKFREIRDVFLSLEYLNVIPQMVREESSVYMTSDKEDYYGRNFLLRMSNLNERTRNKYLRLINEVLSIAVPQLKDLSFTKDSMGVPHIEVRYKHWRAKGSKQNEKLFSDGTLRLIGFLFAMLDGTGIILLEEPESNLHSGIVAQIPEFVARMQRNKKRQIIITTHSFEILSNEGISTNELVVLKNSQEGTIAKNGADIQEVRELMEAGLTAADATLSMTIPEDVEQMNQLNVNE